MLFAPFLRRQCGPKGIEHVAHSRIAQPRPPAPAPDSVAPGPLRQPRRKGRGSSRPYHWVGDHEPDLRVHANEPEVLDELHVIGRQLARHRAGEEGLDHSAHPRLAQPLGQTVEVRVLTLNKLVAGHVDLNQLDWYGWVGGNHFDGLAGEGIDQPGLALGELERAGDRLGGEALSGIGGVLGI